MDFEATEGQVLLVQSAKALLAERFPLASLQALAIGEPVPDLWPDIAALGWTGLLIPEAYGGSGGDMLDAVMLVEEMGYACLPSPFVRSAVAAAGAIVQFGDDAQRARWLPPLASGERTMSVAVAEESGEFDHRSIRATGGPGTPLAGRKLFVKDADRCAELVVAVREGEGVNVLVVPTERCALELMPTVAHDRLFAVDLDGVTVDETCLLGPRRGGHAVLDHLRALGAVARAAEMVGLAQRVLDVCVEHIAVREQSGQPIGAFQALQHPAADMLRNVEGARGIVLRAAWELASDSAHAPAVAMAKAYAGEACLEVARRGHQLMGAIGYCEEHPLHILHKRIHAAGLDFGDATGHLDEVAAGLGLIGPEPEH